MNRMLGRTLAGLALLGTGTALSSACVDNTSTLYVVTVLAPPTSGEGCLYTNDPEAPRISFGRVDAALRTTYEPMLLVANQMLPRASTDGRVETSRIQIQGATVEVTDSAGNEISKFTRLITATIEAGSQAEPGYGIANLTVLDPTTLEDARRTLATNLAGSRRYVATIRLFGQSLGGRDIESAPFQLPVDVCIGCLVYFPIEGLDTARQEAECGRLNCAVATLPACPVGEDRSAPCTECQGAAVCDPTYNSVTGATAPTRRTGEPADCAADARCCAKPDTTTP